MKLLTRQEQTVLVMVLLLLFLGLAVKLYRTAATPDTAAVEAKK